MVADRQGRDGAPRELPPLADEHHTCVQCGIVYADVTVDQALDVLAELPRKIRGAVASVPSTLVRTRPEAATWSVTEYVCHMRDVYATYTIRLHRTRTEEQPVLEPMLNDLRTRRFRYNSLALDAVLDELDANTAGFREEVERLSTEDWSRTARRRPDETRTALWLVRQATHEGVHHLQDIVDVAATVMRTPAPQGQEGSGADA